MACTNNLTSSQTTISSSRRRTGVCALLVGIGSTAGVVALAISLVLVAGAAAAQARPARTAFTECAPLAGLRWSFGGKSGNRYIVETQRFSCTRALKLIPGLMKQQGGRNGGKTLRGPVGYKCLSGSPYHNSPLALAGQCRKGDYSGPGPFFGWAPKVS